MIIIAVYDLNCENILTFLVIIPLNIERLFTDVR